MFPNLTCKLLLYTQIFNEFIRWVNVKKNTTFRNFPNLLVGLVLDSFTNFSDSYEESTKNCREIFSLPVSIEKFLLIPLWWYQKDSTELKKKRGNRRCFTFRRDNISQDNTGPFYNDTSWDTITTLQSLISNGKHKG